MAQAAPSVLPEINDPQFSPAVWTTFHESSTSSYQSIVQFFGADKENISGRFCKLDQKHQPIECVKIKPEIKSQSCSIAAYDPISVQIPLIEYDLPNITNAIEESWLRDQTKKNAVTKAIPLVALSKPGSARSLQIPVGAEIKFISDKEQILAQYSKDVQQGNVHAELLKFARLGCREYFKSMGAAYHFESARTSNRARCIAYNQAIDRSIKLSVERKQTKEAKKLESEKRDCVAYENQSTTLPNRKERTGKPAIQLNLNPFKAVQ